MHLAIWIEPHGVYEDHPWTEKIAVLVWPLLVWFALIWASGKLLEWRHPLRAPLVLAWLASSLVLVPVDALFPTFLNWPLFLPE